MTGNMSNNQQSLVATEPDSPSIAHQTRSFQPFFIPKMLRPCMISESSFNAAQGVRFAPTPPWMLA